MLAVVNLSHDVVDRNAIEPLVPIECSRRWQHCSAGENGPIRQAPILAGGSRGHGAQSPRQSFCRYGGSSVAVIGIHAVGAVRLSQRVQRLRISREEAALATNNYRASVEKMISLNQSVALGERSAISFVTKNTILLTLFCSMRSLGGQARLAGS